MADRGFGERQHAVDPYGADTTGARFGERALDVGRGRPRARDDALQAVVEPAEGELDPTAGVRARGDETSAEAQAAERLRPERAVADVLEQDVDAAPFGDAQDRLEEVLGTIVHRDVRAALARGSRAFVGARGGDDVRAIAHRLDGPRGIDAQDVRERKAREVLAAPDPQAVRAVHRDRTHPQEDLAPADDRIGHVLVAEDLGRTELVHDGRLHLTKRTVASRPA